MEIAPLQQGAKTKGKRGERDKKQTDGAPQT